MKINYLKINGFGKLEKKEIKLNNNINLIYGKNESGKSTLLKFISSMFYGISKNKNGKEFSDFNKFNPWESKDFSGKLIYELDDGESFEIYRDFSKKNPKIYNSNMEDISNNFSIDKTRGNKFFVEQTNIDEQLFFNTSLVEQQAVKLNENNQLALTQKITNILSSGDNSISFKSSIEKLNKKLLEEVGSERTSGRPLNLINNEINDLNNKKNILEKSNLNFEEIKNSINTVKNEIKEKENAIQLIKDMLEINSISSSTEEKIKINNTLLEEDKNKINKLNSEINSIKLFSKNKIINNFNFYIILFLFIISIIFNLIKINKLILFIFPIFSSIYLLFFLIYYFKKNNKLKNENKINSLKINKINYELSMLKENIEKKEIDINNLKSKLNNDKLNNNNILFNKYKNKINNSELNYLINEKNNNLNNKLILFNDELNNLKMKLFNLENENKNINNNLNNKLKIEEKLNYLLDQKQELIKLNNLINLVKNTLQDSYEKVKNEMTPKFTKDLSLIMENVSNGKYKNCTFNDSEGLIVELDSGDYINSNKLSIGTIDQMYLSLRLSSMQEITNETMPIILDESFAYYDSERLENILKFLNENFKKNQIIIFTCTNREKNIFDKLNIEYNFINLN